MSSISPLRLAMIGAGYMASEHLKAFAACPDVQLVGIYSRSTARAQELAHEYPGLTVMRSIDELYIQGAADLVVIAVPELSCLSVCELAFRHPWMLLLEKPVGYTLAQARQIEQLASTCGARAYVGLNRRFYGSTLQLQHTLDSIDATRLVTILDQEDPNAALAAGQPPEVVRNWMYANSIHLIDYFSLLCRGDHLRTHVLTAWSPEDPGPVIAHLQFSSGDVGLYQAVWNAPGPWSVAVSTSKVRAELKPIELLNLQWPGSRQPEAQSWDPLDLQFKPGLLRQARAAILASRGHASSLPTLAEANCSMELVASIYGTK
jgi:predicted dehydrogenase